MKSSERVKEILIHILPVLLGVCFTVFLSLMVYNQMLRNEEQDSWEQLDSVALSMAEKITIRFEDNVNLMGRVADAIRLKGQTDELDTVLEYLDSVQASTIFERIDILLPDNTIVHQNGDRHSVNKADIPYDEVVEMGARYSNRVTDAQTGREVIYCAVPIITDGQPEGMLIGVVDCLDLATHFKTYSFGGTTQVFMIDQADGNYLMNSEQNFLGNIHDVARRERLKGFEEVNHHQDMLEGRSGHVGFVSQANGLASYMAYVPVEGFNWSVSVMAQEDQVLKNVRELSQTLKKIALVEMVLLVSYVLWNLFVGYTLVKQQENVQKMKLETATNAAKSVFLSSVSHDIRTPLNGILGMLDVIDRRKNVPEDLQRDMEKIRVSAEYLVSLANNVLDLNDLESGKGMVEDDRIDLRALGSALEVIVQERFQINNVTFHGDVPVLTHPYVLGSEAYLHRILTNLVSNAVKYNKENGSVWFSAEELESREGESLYRFTVRDNGIGMSEEFLGRLFQAFEQEQPGARSGNVGHGLGLAIVERMVKRMGGTIHVESQKDVGSVFTVTVPFRWDPNGGQEAPQPRIDAGSLNGTRILLVEDNALNMEIANMILSDAGAVITQAFNGRQAVEAFAASEPFHFDVILMDIMMPEMDGCEATSVIRILNRPDAAQVPIIAMTASTFAEDVKRCRDAGMNEHIGKPLNMEALFQLVVKHREAYRCSQVSGKQNGKDV